MKTKEETERTSFGNEKETNQGHSHTSPRTKEGGNDYQATEDVEYVGENGEDDYYYYGSKETTTTTNADIFHPGVRFFFSKTKIRR